MRIIHSSTMKCEDGTQVTATISTQDGGPVSPEDRAFINRFLPLTAGLALEEIARDEA